MTATAALWREARPQRALSEHHDADCVARDRLDPQRRRDWLERFSI
jgi:hypothetical protein